MRLGEFLPVAGGVWRSAPFAGIGMSAAVVLAAELSESGWHKAASVAAAVLTLVSLIIKIAVDLRRAKTDLLTDLNGLGSSLRGHNQTQDEQLKDHEARLKRLESKP